MTLPERIETLSQNIGMLTSALKANTHNDVEYFLKMKAGLMKDMALIDFEINKLLFDKLKQ